MHHSDLEKIEVICDLSGDLIAGNSYSKVLQSCERRAFAYDPLLRWCATEWTMNLIMLLANQSSKRPRTPAFSIHRASFNALGVARQFVMAEVDKTALAGAFLAAGGVEIPRVAEGVVMEAIAAGRAGVPSGIEGVSIQQEIVTTGRAAQAAIARDNRPRTPEQRDVQTIIKDMCMLCVSGTMHTGHANSAMALLLRDFEAFRQMGNLFQPEFYHIPWFLRRLGWLCQNARYAGHRAWPMIESGMPAVAQLDSAYVAVMPLVALEKAIRIIEPEEDLEFELT